MPTLKVTTRMFEHIKRVIASTGHAPTIKELGQQFNMSSPASVHAHLKKMEAQGWIKRTPNATRAIEIVEQGELKAA